MIINLWADIAHIYQRGKKIFFDNYNLEDKLPLILKKSQQESIYVINGPWRFTNVRIWCEIINIFCFVYNKKVYSINKLSIFQQLWIDNIYIFSWNKSKYIYLKKWNVSIVSVENMQENSKCEKLFDSNNINLLKKKVKYMDIINLIVSNKLNLTYTNQVKPYYYFEPITTVSNKSFKKI